MHLLLEKLAILATSILPFCVYSLTVTAAQCIDPVVRKEWRKLSVSEKADWISAVNVSEANILCDLKLIKKKKTTIVPLAFAT
jgi:hypothetical protein